MKLTKLELNGFKSFARKTEILFENGVTAIVGPNGSGKSNIADAVRWVLGEQSAKALRGSKMEDVIFNGTEQKKPLGYCEVVLTFNNSDGVLRTDFAEVAVARRVYRSGDSEYSINRSVCRLKDVHELFRDTGIGKEGYSIIGQGRVEEILSNKSSDRRNAFEEAAGVMKYRVRKEESERKLENTRKNLQRLADILDELERQIEPLAQQSAAAREYLLYRDELKEIEINLFLHQCDKISERLKGYEATLIQLSEEIDKSAALEKTIGADCMRYEERERALSNSINELQGELLLLSSGVEAKSGEAKLVREKILNIQRERERLSAELESNNQKSAALQFESVELEKSVADKKVAFLAQKKEYEQEAAKLTALSNNINETETLLETQKAEVIEALNRMSDAKSALSRFDAIRGTLEKRLLLIDNEETAANDNLQKTLDEQEKAKAQFDEVVMQRTMADKRRSAAINALNEANSNLRSTKDEVTNLMKQGESGKSRLRVLEEMKKAHEGYYASVKNVLRDAERNLELKSKMHGVVAELLKVPSEYETAIEMSLGSALQNIVTPDEVSAKYVIEYLRKKEYGRATLLPVSAMRGRTLDSKEREMCNVNGFIGIASELLSYDEKFRGVFENLLGRTVIVTDLDAGIAINKRARSSFRIATLKGDIINPGGSMTGGSTQKREFSIIGREREIDDLGKRLINLTHEIERVEQKSDTLEQAVKNASIALDVANEALHKEDVLVATYKEKLDIIVHYVKEAEEELDDVRLERQRILDDLASISEQLNAAEQAKTSLAEGNYASEADIKNTRDKLNALRDEHLIANEGVTQIRVKIASLEKECSSTDAELMRTNREREALAVISNKNADKLETLKAEFLDMQSETVDMDTDIEQKRNQVAQLTDEIHKLEEERAGQLKGLDELRLQREGLSGSLAELRERRHRIELNENKARMELSAAQERIFADYELTYDSAEQYRKDIAITASHIRADELKKAIKALGDVNVSSIEDYKLVKERYENMNVQCEDLHKAESDLQELILELVTTMEGEFKRQFELIAANFTEVFSELFGGGRAELVLCDKNDILNCDIDIIAQPPGKKLQLLSLMSGGERALTAIALLFAMLKLKPTAFCILDEIETSLDEVNVSNFANYVKRYSTGTQFILITHRKGSMEVCNALYGVAMEEKGVSKIVSARFNDVI